jgi:membrane-associated phospholipid phosphatase
MQLELSELRAVHAALTSYQRRLITGWNDEAVVRWNAFARELVAKNNTDPLHASRVYALVSMAQYDALRSAEENQRFYQRQMPLPAEGGVAPLVPSQAPGSYPADHAALAAASAAVLTALFPGDRVAIEARRSEQQESRLWAAVNCRSDIIAGDQLGRAVAANLISRANNDLAATVWDGVMPIGEGMWILDERAGKPPMLPGWGKLRPWLMERPDQFRAPPPPAYGSPEFQAALDEVRAISDNRAEEQVRIARFWGDGPNTATPPGHWNQIAAELIVERRLSPLDAVRVLAVLNMALMDAGISAWDTKYTYWLLRPWQADPAITSVVGYPPHPSYVSGHSTFSGAAATLLGAVFPDQAARLEALAEEAAISRVYGGIHYRFDGEAGLAAGRAIGELAVQRWQAGL